MLLLYQSLAVKISVDSVVSGLLRMLAQVGDELPLMYRLVRPVASPNKTVFSLPPAELPNLVQIVHMDGV